MAARPAAYAAFAAMRPFLRAGVVPKLDESVTDPLRTGSSSSNTTHDQPMEQTRQLPHHSWLGLGISTHHRKHERSVFI